MPIPWQNIEGFAGISGVGALCFLGFFLMLDGHAPMLFPTVETFAKTTTWGIVAAVPVIAIAYIIGLLAINGATLFVDQVPAVQANSQIPDLLIISQHDKTAVTEQYLQLRHEKEILSGGFVALVLLTFGAISETRNLSELRKIIILAALGTFLLALVTLGLAILKGEAAHTLAISVQALP